MEGVAASQLTQHLEKVEFLHPHQSAYRAHFSTETATLHVSSLWRSALDQGKMVFVVSLDVTAAFDTVNHEILSSRLIQAGVLGRAHRWFISYLADRSGVVRYDESRSDPFHLSSGVPQGSVLGPCLFNVYMADLTREIQRLNNNVQFHIYADDVLLFIHCSPNELTTALHTLQATVDAVVGWMTSNFLLLSPGKTILFLIRGKRTPLPVPCPTLTIGGAVVEFMVSGSLRWLGVDFDCHLKMDTFVDKTCRTCFTILRMIRQIRSSLDRPSALLLCNALICSRVDYCNSLLASADQGTLSKLQRALNLAARVVTGCRRYDHITPALEELGWLVIQGRVVQKVALLVYQALQGNSPVYLSSKINKHNPRRALRSSTSTAVTLEVACFARTVSGGGAWNVAGPRIWNALPSDVREGRVSPGVFLERLYDFLIA